MKILALDTSSNACSVALLNDNAVSARHEVVPLRHAQYILSYLEDILTCDLPSLNALAWGCGPGSFTGLRIAASVIQALGFAHQLPVINVSSLAALAQTAYQEQGWKRLLVAVDARMNEIYWGAYQVNAEGYVEALLPEGLSSADELSAMMEERLDFSEGWQAVGNAWTVYRDGLKKQLKNNILQVDSEVLPKAMAVALLGKQQYQKGQAQHSFDALPRYLRDNVCTASKRQ